MTVCKNCGKKIQKVTHQNDETGRVVQLYKSFWVHTQRFIPGRYCELVAEPEEESVV